MKIRKEIRFLLNDEKIAVSDTRSDQTLLDFVRLNRRLTGTKEGCAEGDCGACTVLVGRLVNGKLKYQTVNACIRFLASLDKCHVVTVEHLSGKEGVLHPIQQAMVDYHASQCGFCTPGFVMSLYGLLLTENNPTIDQIEKSLQGNLCRCTGYKPIINAALQVAKSGLKKDDPLAKARRKVMAELKQLDDGARVEIQSGESLSLLPADLADFATLRTKYPEATIVAGSTDVGLWVTKHFAKISPTIFITHLDEMATITSGKSGLTLGAMVSYSDAYQAIAKQFPQLATMWDRIGGEQVRNMGTVGGNIANGSPIGDTPPPLIALGAEVSLRKGKKIRTIPLEKFFITYGKQDLRNGEFVSSVHIPALGKSDRFATYKVSKRRDEDITAVCGAIKITTDAHDLITDAVIAFGGMAGTPARARNVEKFLKGKPLTTATFEQARSFMEKDFQPLTDWRASAGYRMLVAKNMLTRFALECAGEPVTISRTGSTNSMVIA